MFCTSLRRRPSCHTIVPQLIANSDPKFKEAQLNSHDIQLPLIAHQNSIKPESTLSPSNLHVLLLSPSSIASDADLHLTHSRIQRFASSNPSSSLLLLLLLITVQSPNPPTPSFVTAKQQLTKTSGTYAYAQLQTLLLTDLSLPKISVLLLSNPEALPGMLKSHATSLSKPQVAGPKPAFTPFDLLKLCTSAPPMREATAYYISDIFTRLRDLASACAEYSFGASSSAVDVMGGIESRKGGSEIDDAIIISSDGIRKLIVLRELVGEGEFESVICFWTGGGLAELISGNKKPAW